MTASYQHYATHDESEFPHLWEGVVGAWAPCLGPSGMRLHDHSGRANWGTLNNMTPATSWVVNSGQYALDYMVAPGLGVAVEDSDALDLIGGMAGMCWFYPRAITGVNFQALFAKRVGAANPTATNYQLFLNNQTGVLGYFNQTLYLSSTTPTINTWNLGAFTRTAAGVLTLFLNGRQVHTATGVTATANAGQLTIGARPTLDLEQLNGLISDVVLWNRFVSANEIRELFEIGRGGMYTPRRRRRAYSFGPSLRRRLILTGQT